MQFLIFLLIFLSRCSDNPDENSQVQMQNNENSQVQIQDKCTAIIDEVVFQTYFLCVTVNNLPESLLFYPVLLYVSYRVNCLPGALVATYLSPKGLLIALPIWFLQSAYSLFVNLKRLSKNRVRAFLWKSSFLIASTVVLSQLVLKIRPMNLPMPEYTKNYPYLIKGKVVGYYFIPDKYHDTSKYFLIQAVSYFFPTVLLIWKKWFTALFVLTMFFYFNTAETTENFLLLLGFPVENVLRILFNSINVVLDNSFIFWLISLILPIAFNHILPQ